MSDFPGASLDAWLTREPYEEHGHQPTHAEIDAYITRQELAKQQQKERAEAATSAQQEQEQQP